jgi:hypothetical protein
LRGAGGGGCECGVGERKGEGVGVKWEGSGQRAIEREAAGYDGPEDRNDRNGASEHHGGELRVVQLRLGWSMVCDGIAKVLKIGRWRLPDSVRTTWGVTEAISATSCGGHLWRGP